MNNVILGLRVMVIGFGTVMLTLFLLQIILLLFEKLFARAGRPAAAPQLTGPSRPADNRQNAPCSAELVAAIAAAVTAYMGPPASGWTVRRITPLEQREGAGRWVLAARRDLLRRHEEHSMLRRSRADAKL